MFDFLAEPHSWIPYDHIGFSRVLYNRSLFFRLIVEFLPRSIWRDFRLMFNWIRFFFLSALPRLNVYLVFDLGNVR